MMGAAIGKLDYAAVEVRMYCTTEIEQRFRLGACIKEPWTVAWIESFPPHSVLYDIGANVGSYTLLAAALGHTVVAIEPTFANYNRLCENVLLNDLGSRVIPLCLGLGNVGECQTMAQEPTPGWSGGTKRLRAPVVPLLDLVPLLGLPVPQYVKLDVDGAELQVLQGASCDAQQMLVEMPRHQEALLEQQLQRLGYELVQRFDEGSRDAVATGLHMKHWWYALWQKRVY